MSCFKIFFLSYIWKVIFTGWLKLSDSDGNMIILIILGLLALAKFRRVLYAD